MRLYPQDEAYELGKGPYGSEACSTLVAAMTDDKKYGSLVIIIAGYQADISSMLDTNTGLRSRFRHSLEFPDWAPSDCADQFAQRAKALNFELDAEAIQKKLLRGFEKLLPLKGWGNARDVEAIWRASLQQRANRIARSGDARVDEKVLTESDVSVAVDDLVAARMGSIGSAGNDSSDPFAPLDNLYRMDGVRKKLQQLKNTHAMAIREGGEPPPLGHFLFLGAPGTGKTTVARIAAVIFHRLGLINRCNVVETTGLDLTGQYVGETKKKVQDQVRKPETQYLSQCPDQSNHAALI